MPISLVRSATLAPTDYAYAAATGAGDRLLFLAGACPLDESGRTVGEGDYEAQAHAVVANLLQALADGVRSEEHTSELQSRGHLVCRLLLEKKKEDAKATRVGNN